MHEYDVPPVTFRGVLDGGDSFAQEVPAVTIFDEPARRSKAPPAPPRPRVDRVKLKATRKRGRKGRGR